MGDKSEDPTKPKARATRKPRRVQLVNTKRSNGAIGEKANVYEKDLQDWLDLGWQPVTATETTD